MARPLPELLLVAVVESTEAHPGCAALFLLPVAFFISLRIAFPVAVHCRFMATRGLNRPTSLANDIDVTPNSRYT
jgi:hypothetical protein